MTNNRSIRNVTFLVTYGTGFIFAMVTYKTIVFKYM